MTTFILQPDDFNLIRMGRKRAFVRLHVATGLYLGRIALTNAAHENMRIEGDIVSITYTRICHLTQDIAVRAGFLYLHDLVKKLLDGSQLGEDLEVTVIEFACDRDKE